MSNEILPPEPDLELVEALQQLRTKREPWYLDRWLIATFAAIGGAIFMYVARQPEIDFYRRSQAKPKGTTQKAPVNRVEPPAQAPVQGPPAVKPPTGTALADPKAGNGAPVEDVQAVKEPTADKGKQAPPPTIGGNINRRQVPPFNPGEIGIMGEASQLPGVTGAPDLGTSNTQVEPIHGLTIAGTGSSGSGGTLASIAKKFGGGLKKYEEYTGRDKSTSGYIVWVPEKNSRAFLDKLKSAGGIDISSQDEGSSGSRSRVLTENLNTILAKLTKQRSELLIKYYEDAPAVKEIDGQIAEVNKSIHSMRTPGAGYAVAKIEVG